MTRVTETSDPLSYNKYLEWRDIIGDFMMSFARAEFIIMRGLIENTNLSFEDIHLKLLRHLHYGFHQLLICYF